MYCIYVLYCCKYVVLFLTVCKYVLYPVYKLFTAWHNRSQSGGPLFARGEGLVHSVPTHRRLQCGANAETSLRIGRQTPGTSVKFMS